MSALSQATKFIEDQARALAQRVSRREINESCVEGLLRESADHATDSREAMWIVFEHGRCSFEAHLLLLKSPPTQEHGRE